MTLIIGSIFKETRRNALAGSFPLKSTRIPKFFSRWLKAFGDFFFGNSALFYYFPVGFGKVHRSGTLPGARSAVENQVYASVHRGEQFNTARHGWVARNVGAGRYQRVPQLLQKCVQNRRVGLTESKPTGVPRDLQWNLPR